MKRVTVMSDTYDRALETTGTVLKKASTPMRLLNEAHLAVDQFGMAKLAKPEVLSVYEPVAKLHFITRGEGMVHIDGKRHALSAGNVYLIAPHEMEIRSPAGLEKLYARFTLTLSGIDLLRSISVSARPAGAIARAAEQAFSGANISAVKAVLYEALSLFEHDIVSAATQAQRFSRYARFVAHVSSHMGERTVIDDAVMGYGVTVRHFAECFKAAFGVTPKAYVTARRIERAKELLAADDMPIDAIAQSLGFDDRSHFSKCFKVITGGTPGKFRKTYGADS